MIKSWSSWKRFPDGSNGESIVAPIGPGIYEVRHTDSGELVAFGHSANVANSITELKVENRRRGWISMFRPQTSVPHVKNLEYRTCATADRAEARTAAHRLMGLRQSYWRRRTVMDWASGGHA